jgi:hypothetical protein
MRAVLSMPSRDGPFPVVVTIHGGQGNRDLALIRTLAVPGGISQTVTMLNEQPWAVLAISYRAGGGGVLGMEQDDVVAGAPWMTNPRVYLFGKPDQPPLSEISAQARAVVFSTRATVLPGLQRNRG